MSPETNNSDRFIIRRLTENDAASYREIRLEGLKNYPSSFGASYEYEASKSVAWFSERSQGATVFGGFDQAELVGVAGISLPMEAKLNHKGVLFGMYVKPDARGSGLAKSLVENLIEHSKTLVEEILLTVSASNIAAAELYRGLGFVEYGIEPRAMKIGDDYYDELLMRLPLKSAG